MAVWQRRFRALTTVVEVRTESAEVVAALAALLGTYEATAEPPMLSYRIAARTDGGIGTWRDGELWHEADAVVDVAPVLELDLYRQAVARAEKAVVMHGACLERDGRAAVFVGHSGAGKTTLVRALVENGAARYMSEEAAAVFEDDTVAGLCRPLNVDAVPPRPSTAFVAHDYTWRRRGGELTVSHLLHPDAERIAYGPLPLARLFTIEYVADAASAVSHPSPGESLARMWPCALSQTPRCLSHLTSLLKSHAVIHVQSRSVDDVCRLVLDAWNAP